MSQFRSTADILDEVLSKAGEPTNGNSPFESTALTYVNKMHHFMVAGGNCFNLEADEPWVWARAKHPIVLELLPAETGSCVFTNNSLAITFGSTPSQVLTGWYIRAGGTGPLYRIQDHTAAGTTASQSLAFNETPASGSITFSWKGYNTAAIPATAGASYIQSAFRTAFPSVNFGVTGNMIGTLSVTFGGWNGTAPSIAVVANSLVNAGGTAIATSVVFSDVVTGVAATPTRNAALDSRFLGTTGTLAFTAFKLDYPVSPDYFYIDENSNRIDLNETASTASGTKFLTVKKGTYTPDGLAFEIENNTINPAVSGYWGVTWDSKVRKFHIASSTGFSLLGGTGGNAANSILPVLGFAQADHTAASAYTSSSVPNSISRLIEPFMMTDRTSQQVYIYSADPQRMQYDFPLHSVKEGNPDRFARIKEESDGTVWVRFNAYPKAKTKITMDWIPQPIDLSDNAVSRPKVPRVDIDTLINGAAAMLAFDKEDSKWEGLYNLAKTGLQAMVKRNRAALFRTGENFAQIVPREDVTDRGKLRYGYSDES